MASLVTCLLELEVEDMVGAELVRRFRQRELERAKREGGNELLVGCCVLAGGEDF